MKNYRSITNRVRDVLVKSRVQEMKMPPGQKFGRDSIEKDQSDQIVAGTYKTKHFEMCPKAQKLFVSLEKIHHNPDVAEKSAILHDKLFWLEKQAISHQRSTADDTKEAEDLVKRIEKLAPDMGVEGKTGYLKDHIAKIKSLEQEDKNVFDDPIDKNEITKRFTSPPSYMTKEPEDRDIDNTKFFISRSIKGQRKLKIIDAD